MPLTSAVDETGLHEPTNTVSLLSDFVNDRASGSAQLKKYIVLLSLTAISGEVELYISEFMNGLPE